ncbi:hypothetical protein [Bradyrhizobium sp. LHD-71]|uniref:hypothetical protein n=1 Tax=Bradyrhizobium sp. LHD-71 TaxID=3072141 RepID=UPI00280D8C5F|nr:hypothetical protein [Bradyrhizobium sp. LHD-71]MDQ8729425.1 hypothetical protein [Bradyrhizobium sp. LHD-71]
MKLKMLASAAAIAVLVGTPAVAQQTERFAGPQQQSPSMTGGQRMQSQSQYGSQSGSYYNSGRRSGIAPVDAAAGVAGAAVGTAGAVATAPLRGDSYAYQGQTMTPRAQRQARSMRGQYRDSQAYYTGQRGSQAYSAGSGQAYYGGRGQAYYGGSGVAPLDAAAGVVGGAVGTAAAIAASPFTNAGYGYRDSYAYSPGVVTNGGYGVDYNGPYCAPGTFVMMDGEPVPCQ